MRDRGDTRCRGRRSESSNGRRTVESAVVVGAVGAVAVVVGAVVGVALAGAAVVGAAVVVAVVVAVAVGVWLALAHAGAVARMVLVPAG